MINNAAIAPSDDTSVLTQDDEITRRVFETNFFGTLRVARAFAPVLADNGGGAFLNVLSAAIWIPVPTAYAASKAAAWSATNAMRAELTAQGTTVTAVVVGMVDTAMSARWDMPKVSAESVVEQSLDGVLSGAFEVLADDDSRLAKSLLSEPYEELHAVAVQALSDFKP